MEKETLNVQGMTCMGCVRSVEAALGQLPGVRRVDVDLASGRVDVEREAGEPTRQQLTEAIEDAGFDVIG